MQKKQINNISSKILNTLVLEIRAYFVNRDILVLIYGSFAIGNTNSDLDVCLITDSYTKRDIAFLKNMLRDIHIKYNLKIDDEMPIESKGIYTYNDCKYIINNPPFKYRNGEFVVEDFSDDSYYLYSREAKNRLLLNIFIGRTNVLDGDVSWFLFYKDKMIESFIICMFISTHNSPITISEFVYDMCKNPKTSREYKDYLGFSLKKDYNYLFVLISNKFHMLCLERKLVTDNGVFKVHNHYLNEFRCKTKKNIHNFNSKNHCIIY